MKKILTKGQTGKKLIIMSISVAYFVHQKATFLLKDMWGATQTQQPPDSGRV